MNERQPQILDIEQVIKSKAGDKAKYVPKFLIRWFSNFMHLDFINGYLKEGYVGVDFCVKEGSTVPRRGRITKRDVLPDPLYGSKLVTKLINNVMYDGKKGVAQTIVYDAFKIVEEKLGQNPLDMFQEALENVMPVLEVKARRVGGSTYQVPMEVRAERRQTLGLRWLVAAARNRSERTMAERLAGEITDAKNSMGGAFKKKEETHRMAEANKAFAHYRY